MRSRNFAVAAVALTAIAVASIASAATVYNTPKTTPGDQAYGDVLGSDFTVNASGLKVTDLGAFDSTKAGIGTDVSVGLYNLTTSTWVIAPIDFNGTADPSGNSYVWKAISPYTLTDGDEYSVVGLGFNSIDQNFNTNISGQNGLSPITFDSFGGELTNGWSRYGGGGNPSASIVFPYSSAFGAGSLAIGGVPEPATWAMMLLGVGMIGGGLRMARRKNDLAMTAA
jgi:hypothetical protein